MTFPTVTDRDVEKSCLVLARIRETSPKLPTRKQNAPSK